MAVGAGELDRLDALDDGAYRLEIRDWAEMDCPIGLPRHHRPYTARLGSNPIFRAQAVSKTYLVIGTAGPA